MRTKKDVRDRVDELKAEIERMKSERDPKDEHYVDFVKYDDNVFEQEALSNMLELDDLDFDEKHILQIYKHGKKYEEMFGMEVASQMQAAEWVLMREPTEEELLLVEELADDFHEQIARMIESMN